MDGVTLTPLKQMLSPKGDVLHALKKSEDSFCGFGEAYFSSVHCGTIKGWKKHTKMTLNLVVPVGAVEFVCYDGSKFESIVLSKENYQRLTVKPGVWMAFRGVGSGANMLINIADIEHDPLEAVNCDLEEIHYEW